MDGWMDGRTDGNNTVFNKFTTTGAAWYLKHG